jgi:hypothetical protein
MPNPPECPKHAEGNATMPSTSDSVGNTAHGRTIGSPWADSSLARRRARWTMLVCPNDGPENPVWRAERSMRCNP